MSQNFDNQYQPSFITVDGSQVKNTFLVAAGALGWIDTDITGSDVPLAAKAIFISGNPAAAVAMGVVRHGDTQGKTCDSSGHVTFLTGQSTAGHVDLYRAGSNITYNILGYIL